MRWAEAHRVAMGEAFEAHEDLGLDTQGRVDVFAAIASADVKLHFRPLDCAALYLPAAVTGRPGVLVNNQHPLALQRYSAAHELGHHVFGHGEQIDRDSEPRGSGATLPPHEMLAEAFAAWFLMPPEAVDAALRLLGIDRVDTAADAYALSLRLGTSFRATCNRIPELTRWREASVKDIKMAMTFAPPLGGWRNDVWLLTQHDAAAPIVARAGDTLLLDLAGWDIDRVPAGTTAELAAGADLLTPSRWRVDLPPDLTAGPAPLALTQAGSSLAFQLFVERPRTGRYIPSPETRTS